MASATYLIPARNLSELEGRIAKLNKRAEKLKVEPITYTKAKDHVRLEALQPVMNARLNPDGSESFEPNRVWIAEGEAWGRNQASAIPAKATGRRMDWFRVEVTGKVPSFEGWTFVAVLEAVQAEDGEWLNVVREVPGQECPTHFRDRVGTCDHCKAKRNRKETFVVRHENGTFKTVGRQCLKDFLGYNADPHNLAAAAELFMQLGAFCKNAEDADFYFYDGCGAYQPPSYDLKVFLAWVASRVEKDGWLGRGVAYEQGRQGHATVDYVLYYLNRPSARYTSVEAVQKWQKAHDEYMPEPRHYEAAEAAIDWAHDVVAPDNTYLTNVNTIARVGEVSYKSAGIGASILVAYKRAVDEEVKRQEFNRRPESKHIGEVGKRCELTVKVGRIISKDSNFGLTGIHLMTAIEGGDVVWFASGAASWLREGQTYKVKATVKGHGSYNGRPQTTVQRVTILEEIPSA